MRFDEILGAIDKLPPADQQAIFEILERRRIADRRTEIAKDVAEARREFQAGECKPATAQEIVKELLS
jgi:hypothetical protein